MQCPTGKYQFKYRIDAVEANISIGTWTNEYCSVYHCTWCGDWHLTSRGKKKRKRKFKY